MAFPLTAIKLLHWKLDETHCKMSTGQTKKREHSHQRPDSASLCQDGPPPNICTRKHLYQKMQIRKKVSKKKLLLIGSLQFDQVGV
jgi:hypothetical protein